MGMHFLRGAICCYDKLRNCAETWFINLCQHATKTNQMFTLVVVVFSGGGWVGGSFEPLTPNAIFRLTKLELTVHVYGAQCSRQQLRPGRIPWKSSWPVLGQTRTRPSAPGSAVPSNPLGWLGWRCSSSAFRRAYTSPFLLPTGHFYQHHEIRSRRAEGRGNGNSILSYPLLHVVDTPSHMADIKVNSSALENASLYAFWPWGVVWEQRVTVYIYAVLVLLYKPDAAVWSVTAPRIDLDHVNEYFVLQHQGKMGTK